MTTKITNIGKESRRVWHQGKFADLKPGESILVEKSLSGNILSHPDFKIEAVAESEEKTPKTNKKVKKGEI